MERISRCSFDDYDGLRRFIDQIWSKDHVLGSNRDLMDFQHKTTTGYNFVISKNSMNQITSILGYIPTYQYDISLSQNIDCWLAIWKVDVDSATPGIGLALLQWLEKNLSMQSVGAIGINSAVGIIYKALGYKTGILNQYYFINPKVKKFQIAKPEISKTKQLFRSRTSLKNIDQSQLSTINYHHRPQKSVEYIKNRYLDHPFYKYFMIGAYKDGKLLSAMIIRKIEINGSACLRIVDIQGDYSKIGFIGSELAGLLNEYDCEYIDCLNHGIPKQLFLDWGFSLRNSQSIIPNYFEPFLQENIDIQFAYRSTKEDYLIFKGDSDQDRPNIL